MKITNIDFTDEEWAAIEECAACVVLSQGNAPSRKQAVAYCKRITPQNVIRLSYGFKVRKRGGLQVGGFGRNKKEDTK